MVGQVCRLALLVCLAIIGAACSGSGPISGGNCVTNRDCPADEICIAGKCQGSNNNGGCQNNDQCPLGEFCDLADNTCKVQMATLCQNDDACPANQRCNTATGVCIDGARSCTMESQCTSIGKHCDTTVQQCRDCVDQSHCPTGFNCTNGTCVDPNTNRPCTGDFTCMPPNTICENSMCVPGCAAPVNPMQCGSGTVCNMTSGRCVPGQVNCSSDPECGAPTGVCESMQCVPGCAQPGGIQCTGGNVCDPSTGRCIPPAACGNDAQCGAPARICENSACVPGCGAPGGLSCGAGTVCDTNTGRCVPLQGPCMMDSQCNPPMQVCELGQCIPGCAEPGGIQCSGQLICNATTGRCEQGQGFCQNDAACGAPAQICDTNSGMCTPGCGTAGCTGQDTCNQATGRCEPPFTGAPLNGPCTTNNDCDSRVCFNLDGVGQRCVQSCGSSADCPASYTCFDYDGAKMCLHSSLFTGATFSGANGSPCLNAGMCRSGFCPNNQCVEVCTEDSNCGGGSCGWSEQGTNFYLAACNGPIGAGAPGANCNDDANCRSGICFQNSCAAPCASTADCNTGSTCSLLNYSICTFSVFGACVRWAPNFTRACVAGQHGNDAVGAACTTFANCRSGLCHTGISQCTDTCGTNNDCPSTHRCKIVELGQLSDDTIVWLNVCMPTDF